MLVSEREDNGVICECMTLDGILGDHAVFVFDFHRNRIIRQKGFRLLKDGRHFPGLDAVIVVLAHPDLKLAGGGFSEFAAAIEEGLLKAADFGDVEGDRHRIPIGQSDAEKSVGVLGEKGLEFEECHRRLVLRF